MSWTQEVQNSQLLDFGPYPSRIPPHILKVLNDKPSIAKQFEASKEELNQTEGFIDPIGDELKSKGSGIIHRYQNRILFTPTTVCPVNCRYCFRKNELHQNKDFLKGNLNKLESYLKSHQEIEEVILTGGDPLMLSNKKLSQILKVCSDQGVSYLRIHTRMPIAIPSRIDPEFIETFRQYQSQFKKFFFVLHTNHTDELQLEVIESLQKLPSDLFQKLTQSVLLKGVNDDALVLKNLFTKLVELNFHPYYLHHPDKVKGAMHFYISKKQGLQIYNKLRSISSGWMVPHYIIDDPSGSGKKLTVDH